jgi:HPt (histidine-containing phosphotransfer) domain-containing protein
MQGDAQRCLAAGMDAYLTKPLRFADLYAVIDRLLDAEPTPQGTLVVAHPPPVDLSRSLLASADKTRLGQIVPMLQQDYPRHIAELCTALQARDAASVARLAHRLGGVVSVLGATTAQRLACQLEELGRSGALEAAGSMLQALQNELERVAVFYAELCQDRCDEVND